MPVAGIYFFKPEKIAVHVMANVAAWGIMPLANGKTAARLYERFILPQTDIPITALPSTSPANAAFSLDDLCERWRIICTL